MTKKIYYSERFFLTSKYYNLKGEALKVFRGMDVWAPKYVLRKMKVHPYVIDRIVCDLVKEGLLDCIETTSGKYYKAKAPLT